MPKRIEFRDELARTATGKLQKFKLRAPYWEGHDAPGQLTHPRFRVTELPQGCLRDPKSAGSGGRAGDGGRGELGEGGIGQLQGVVERRARLRA